jgi:uncharacterized membrane protein YfcA
VEELLKLLLLAVIGGLAGFINVMAGGGSLLTLPFLIFLGLPAAMANGTNRIAILVQNISATVRFHKFDVIPKGTIFITTVPAVAGSIIGAQLAIDIDELLFKRILAIIMLFVMAITFFGGGLAKFHNEVALNTKKKIVLASAFFGIGIYGGFIQAGVGFLIIMVLSLTGYDLVKTNALKILIVLVYTPVALGIFVLNGQIDIIKGLVLSVGNATGAWLATHVVVEKGHNFVRWIVLVAVVVFAAKLFFG